jgi:hypothetical protein
MTGKTFLELCSASNAELEAILQSALAPDFNRLAGFEWRGANMSALPRLLGLQKFIKGFFYDGDQPAGYNVKVRQNGLDAEWIESASPGRPRRFGFYLVCPAQSTETDRIYPRALVLDYGASPHNPPFRIERSLRDYLVQPDPDNPDVLLGKAYFAIGSARLPSNFFVLERLGRAPLPSS